MLFKSGGTLAKISDNIYRISYAKHSVNTSDEGCRCTVRVDASIPLLMLPQTFLSPFVVPPPVSSPCGTVYHTSRPSLSQGVHRSHECACIRIPAVRSLNLRPLCPPLISWNQERFASKSDVFAGDQNIFPPARLRDYPMRA